MDSWIIAILAVVTVVLYAGAIRQTSPLTASAASLAVMAWGASVLTLLL